MSYLYCVSSIHSRSLWLYALLYRFVSDVRLLVKNCRGQFVFVILRSRTVERRTEYNGQLSEIMVSYIS